MLDFHCVRIDYRIQKMWDCEGGGVFDSKTQCNPSPYVPTAYRSFSQRMAREGYEIITLTNYISYLSKKPVAIAAGFCCTRISLLHIT